jgi:NodT family efflux transporter outer membrane factor (OMF) lipoprotein
MRRLRLALLVLASASMLTASGCGFSIGPDYSPPDLEVPHCWSQTPDGGLRSSDDAQDLSEWWNALGDPMLSDLIEQSRAGSPDIRTAVARLREARARHGLASADRLPRVDASLTRTHLEESTETGLGATRDLYDASIDASWERDLFGGTRRAVEAARADLESAEARLHDAQASLAAEVGLAYVELRTSQARLEIARERAERQQETFRLVTWRAEAGLIGWLDVEQARTDLEQTRSKIPSLEASTMSAMHRLEVLLGRQPASLCDVLSEPAPLPSVPDDLAMLIPADALRGRPDVRAAERRLAAETARLGQAVANRYPSVHLKGTIGLEALSWSALTGGGAGFSSLVSAITAPIFHSGRIKQQIRIQDSIREQALVAYESAVLAALVDVEDALVAFASSGRQVAALERATESARAASTLAEDSYDGGLVDFLTVLDSERSVLAIEDELQLRKADRVSSVIRLYKAVGGGWTPLDDRPADASPKAEGE